MTDYKKLSENAFNIQAKTYDTDKNGKHARNLYQDIIKALSSLQFSNVLDVGCGTGEVLSIIRKLYPTALLYGIDISEEMLKKAEEKKIDQRQKMNRDMTLEWLSLARIYVVIYLFVTLIVGVTLYLRFHIQKMMWQIFGRILTH